MPNQIRLTVLGPRSGPQQDAAACDVLVTAPAGTVLATVAGALATAHATASGVPASPGDPVTLYCGSRRLDPQRQMVGEPPLMDGAVVTLHAPSGHPATAVPDGIRLDVVAGPDAGGVHLLHGGRVRIGRSTGADVVLDDPDVSRLHCAVTVADTGAVTVTDLGSTNGTSVNGRPVHDRPAPLLPGAALRVGETLLRLHAPAEDRRTGTGHSPDAPEAPVRPAVREAATTRQPTPLRGTAAPVPAQNTGPARRNAAGRPVGGARAPEEIEHRREQRSDDGAAGTHRAGHAHPVTDHEHPGHGGAAGTEESAEDRRSRGGIGGWARRLTGRRAEGPEAAADHGGTAQDAGPRTGVPAPRAAGVPADGRWPDPAEVLLTALGQGPRLWERGADHPHALTARLGTAHHGAHPDAPVAVALRRAGSLGLAGPRERLLPMARSVLAQLAVLHPPSLLEVVLIASGRAGAAAEWSWLGWLPHTRAARGQDCRLLFGLDRTQAAARAEELTRRVDEGPLGSDWVTAERADVLAAAGRHRGPATVVVVDGDPGTAALRESVARLAAGGSSAGVHVLCLAETPATTPSSPFADTLASAYAALPAFRECGSAALLSGAVATAVRLVERGGDPTGALATVDGVSAAWAQRFARALAPVREPEPAAGAVPAARPAVALPPGSRLLDELGLARATPAALLARWSPASGEVPGAGAASLVLGAGPRGPVTADLGADRSHLLVSGAAGSGKTELLCSLAAALAAGERPDRLGLVLIDGDGAGLGVCAELPHASMYLSAGEPVRMRGFAQALSGELKRRAELLGTAHFDTFAQQATETAAARRRSAASDLDSGTLRLRPRAGGGAASAPVQSAPPLPRLVVLVDDFDVLVDPALGNPGRPAAGSVVRALESVARDGIRLGVHLVAATGRPDRTAATVADQGAAMRVALGGDPDDPASAEESRPGRGALHRPDGSVTPFQGSRVTGRIPRTATLRPTVVALDWDRAGDPPSRRPVRELGNGPTDLALLASATERAAREAGAEPVPPLG